MNEKIEDLQRKVDAEVLGWFRSEAERCAKDWLRIRHKQTPLSRTEAASCKQCIRDGIMRSNSDVRVKTADIYKEVASRLNGLSKRDLLGNELLTDHISRALPPLITKLLKRLPRFAPPDVYAANVNAVPETLAAICREWMLSVVTEHHREKQNAEERSRESSEDFDKLWDEA